MILAQHCHGVWAFRFELQASSFGTRIFARHLTRSLSFRGQPKSLRKGPRFYGLQRISAPFLGRIQACSPLQASSFKFQLNTSSALSTATHAPPPYRLSCIAFLPKSRYFYSSIHLPLLLSFLAIHMQHHPHPPALPTDIPLEKIPPSSMLPLVSTSSSSAQASAASPRLTRSRTPDTASRYSSPPPSSAT